MLTKNLLENIKIFITDVDGVLTDGTIYYSSDGKITRRYSMHDGLFKELKKRGIATGICTGENDDSIKLRANKLAIDHLILGSKDKVNDISALLNKLNLKFENLAYVGDDLNDVEVLKKAGVAFSVRNGKEVAKKHAHYISKLEGGKGAIREIIDLMISKLDNQKQRVGIVLFAKMWSKRLNGKPLLDVKGKPLLSYNVDNLKKCKLHSDLILATTLDASDDAIVDFAMNENIKIFRGKETEQNRDLLGSIIECANENNLDIIVRICGDSPFIEPEQIDRLIEEFSKNKLDYLSLKTKDGKPIILSGWGLAVEVVSLSALKRARFMTNNKSDLEHFTAFIYKNPDKFKIKYLDYPKMFDFNHDEIRLTIDYKEDLDILNKILNNLPQNDYSLDNVLSYLKSNTKILKEMKEKNNANKKTV